MTNADLTVQRLLNENLDEDSISRIPLLVEGKATGRRLLSGLQPSGNLHLGNYFGAMQQHIDGQQTNEGFFFIATYHALTTVKDAKVLQQLTLDVALDYLAVGLDPERVALYRQTDLPEVTELAWILGCVGSVGDLDRAVSYKEKVGHGLVPNIGLYTYPVLMAADILIMEAEVVPVGQDQLQHIEMARRFATRFNRVFNRPVFTIPQAQLNESRVVPGTDGQKMSKSYGNTIPLFADRVTIRDLMFSIRTDSAPAAARKDHESCRLFAILKLLGDDDEAASWAQRYRNGGLKYGDVKQRLVELYEEKFGAAREYRKVLAEHPERVEEVLREGARKASRIAQKVMEGVREVVGIPTRPARTLA
jgi:tryptophanyl-tRNA synthetase